MTTVDKLGWLMLGIVLLVAVAGVIIQPIFSKAEESKNEMDNIKFEVKKTSLNIDNGTYLRDGSKVVWTA